MNLEVVWCVLILIFLCVVGAVGSGTWLASFDEYVPFLNTLTMEDTNPAFQVGDYFTIDLVMTRSLI
jgi:hypothetical protein